MKISLYASWKKNTFKSSCCAIPSYMTVIQFEQGGHMLSYKICRINNAPVNRNPLRGVEQSSIMAVKINSSITHFTVRIPSNIYPKGYNSTLHCQNIRMHPYQNMSKSHGQVRRTLLEFPGGHGHLIFRFSWRAMPKNEIAIFLSCCKTEWFEGHRNKNNNFIYFIFILTNNFKQAWNNLQN